MVMIYLIFSTEGCGKIGASVARSALIWCGASTRAQRAGTHAPACTTRMLGSRCVRRGRTARFGRCGILRTLRLRALCCADYTIVHGIQTIKFVCICYINEYFRFFFWKIKQVRMTLSVCPQKGAGHSKTVSLDSKRQLFTITLIYYYKFAITNKMDSFHLICKK